MAVQARAPSTVAVRPWPAAGEHPVISPRRS